MPFLTNNLELGPPLRLSPWRKIAIGTWKPSKEGTVYGVLELPAEPMLHFIGKTRHKTGVKITVTHFVGKAIALGFKKHPALNCVLRFGKLYPRKNVGVFFQVATHMGGQYLNGTTVYDAD
jgi:pyruvate/2-oxoglutarate dehydrogenase complex dihydrolipoamide acyltransferase (E2) component